MRIEDLKLHMIIEAYSKEEGLEIAKSELDYIHKVKGEKISQARVSAYNLNDKGFDYFIQKLGKRDLIIENAGRIKEQEIDNIEEFMLNKRNTNIVVLVDVINNFDRLAKNRPSFLDRFDIYSVVSAKKQEKIEVGENRPKEVEPKIIMSESEKKIVTEELESIKQNIKNNEDMIKKVEKIVEKEEQPIVKNEELIEKAIEAKREKAKNKHRVHEENKTEEFNIDKFVEYCKNYAKSIDCVIPGKVTPALYEVVEEMVEEGMKLNEENAINLIEDAADRAEKPKLFSKPKYDKDGCLIIAEEHLL